VKGENGMPERFFNTPLGLMTATEEDGRLISLDFVGTGSVPGRSDRTPLLLETERQINAYFKKELTRFDVPLKLSGTPFQQAVWARLMVIPYGKTATYGRIALEAGRPGAARAAGGAIHRNPVSIIVPCHRVIGASGALTGYGGGLDRKMALLELEGRS